MYKLNWRRDPYLERFPKSELYAMPMSLPSKVDLKSIMPPVVNQGEIGSCTANAWCYLLGALAIKGVQTHVVDPEQFNKKFSPLSRLFLYWNERYIQGTTHEDSGATLSEGMQAVQVWGICRESTWHYSDANEFQCPPRAAYSEAVKHKIPKGQTVDNSQLDQLKLALFNGFPVVYGMDVFRSFFSTGADGMVPMPDAQNEQLMGGHALCIVGYDDAIQCFTIINSWGQQWGDKGFCYIPYSYLTDQNLASDFWTLKIGV